MNMKILLGGVAFAVTIGVVAGVGIYAGSWLGESIFGDKDV